MQTAESHRLLAPEQFGSWKSKATGTQCLNKWLFYDLYWCLCAPAVLCSNDAKSCYDWILLIIAALCLCHFGATKAATKSMITTLAQLHHHANSLRWFKQHQGQNEWTLPTAGIGQGNGARLQIWVAVSSPLFEIMPAKGFLATFICAIAKEHRSMVGFAFVDDTDLIASNPSQVASKVTEKMQQSLTLWHKLLQATGRDLVPEKCIWYLIDFKWQNSAWVYKTTQELPGQIQVTSTTNKCIVILWLEPWEACRTLRVCIALDGNNDAKVQYLSQVAADWRTKMAMAHILCKAAEFSIWHVLYPKLWYPLIATTFSEAQCQNILNWSWIKVFWLWDLTDISCGQWHMVCWSFKA